jgi:hypothetical protein
MAMHELRKTFRLVLVDNSDETIEKYLEKKKWINEWGESSSRNRLLVGVRCQNMELNPCNSRLYMTNLLGRKGRCNSVLILRKIISAQWSV